MLDGRLKVTALGPDARHQERGIRRQGTQSGELAGRGCPDHESDAFAAPAIRRPQGHALEERLPVDQLRLKPLGARVARATQEIDDPIRIRQKWLDRILPEVRRKRHRVRRKMAEQAGRVPIGGGANIPALRVQDAVQLRRDMGAHVLKGCPAGGPQGLEEGNVELDRYHMLRDGIEQSACERFNAASITGEAFGQLIWVRVDAETEWRPETSHPRTQTSQWRGRHETAASSGRGSRLVIRGLSAVVA